MEESELRDLNVTVRLQLDHPDNLVAHAGDPGMHRWVGQELASATAAPATLRRSRDASMSALSGTQAVRANAAG
jgi:hypothetical protein